MYPNLKYNSNNEDKLLEIEIKSNENFNIDFINSIQELEKVLAVFVEMSNYARKNKILNYFPFINFAIHLNTLLLDHKVSAMYLSNSKSEWEKRYFIRIISILIYEALKDIPELLGKKFRESINNNIIYDGFLEELKGINSDLFSFKYKNFTLLNKVRNNTFGHREKESLILVKEILDLNFSKTIEMCGEFDKILRNYGEFIQKILKIAPS